ncbi:MAG: DNA-formamidopyrimidine glycosylase family protein, partial [Alphaproteobacteria bacterium]
MPELPEVETVRRGMEPVLRGRRIQDVVVRRGDLRRRVPKNFKDRVAGRVAAEILRRGKYIVVMLEGGGGFVLHLGMSGRIKIRKADSGEDYATHDHVVFVLENRTEIIFNDPRRFGMVFPVDTDWEKETPFSEMGPEPLEKKFTAQVLHEKIKNKNATIKSA